MLEYKETPITDHVAFSLHCLLPEAMCYYPDTAALVCSTYQDNLWRGGAPIDPEDASKPDLLFGEILWRTLWIQVANYKLHSSYTSPTPFPCRHVILPKDIASLVPKDKLMSETEWRKIGVQQSRGWVHYMYHKPGTVITRCMNMHDFYYYFRASYFAVSKTNNWIRFISQATT